MCFMKTPNVAQAAAEQVPERQAARSPDNGDPTVRTNDRARRRLALAASIFTPQNGSLGAPSVSGPTTAVLGA